MGTTSLERWQFPGAKGNRINQTNCSWFVKFSILVEVLAQGRTNVNLFLKDSERPILRRISVIWPIYFFLSSLFSFLSIFFSV